MGQLPLFWGRSQMTLPFWGRLCSQPLLCWCGQEADSGSEVQGSEPLPYMQRAGPVPPHPNSQLAFLNSLVSMGRRYVAILVIICGI